jgi:hypothetical protein
MELPPTVSQLPALDMDAENPTINNTLRVDNKFFILKTPQGKDDAKIGLIPFLLDLNQIIK